MKRKRSPLKFSRHYHPSNFVLGRSRDSFHLDVRFHSDKKCSFPPLGRESEVPSVEVSFQPGGTSGLCVAGLFSVTLSSRVEFALGSVSLCSWMDEYVDR